MLYCLALLRWLLRVGGVRPRAREGPVSLFSPAGIGIPRISISAEGPPLFASFSLPPFPPPPPLFIGIPREPLLRLLRRRGGRPPPVSSCGP